MKKKSPSWGAVIVVLILFWPLGLYMLYKKLTSNSKLETYQVVVESVQSNSLTPLDTLKQKARKKIKWSYVLLTIGVILILAIFSNLNSIGEFLYRIILIAIFGGSGLLLLRNGQRMSHIISLYEKYYPVIVNSNNGEVKHFASATSTPINQVIADLNELLDMKLLGDSYLDQTTMKLCSPLLKTEDFVRTENKLEAIKCSSCGGMNLPISGHQECEYCGTVIG